jgi:predicted TIM-barrel fold metal-dependent hydrolase
MVLTRRSLLQGAGLATAAAPRATSLGVLREALRYRKIDSHNHLTADGPRKLIEAADLLGIERLAVSVPFAATPEAFRKSNDTVLQAMREFPKRLLGQCIVNPVYQKESLAEMDRCLDAGMIGLGELYDQVKISDPLYYPIIEKCIALKCPIMMHARADLGLVRKGYRLDAPVTTSISEDFVAAARRYPEALLIHGHIGGGGDWEYMCKTLRTAPSVYLDTSGSVTDDGMIELAVRELGVARLLFATDLNFESGVGKILAADLTEAQRRAIFWDNFNGILSKRGNHAN